jgi:CNT family concentrative nucleoside transporter
LLLAARSALGLLVILTLAWAFSENRRGLPSWRWIGGAILLQIVIGLAVLRAPFVWDLLRAGNAGIAALESATRQASSYMFGYLGGGELPFDLKPGAAAPVIIAFQILPLVIVTSALAALLWHWGVLKAIVRFLSWGLQRTLGVSGVVGLNAGANVFLGVVEAPLVVRAYFEKMSRSELFAVMVLGMATVSGVVLVLYAQTLSAVVDNAFGHLIAASLITLPASLLIARIMVPGEGATDAPDAGNDLKYEGAIDAVIRGTMDGLQLFLVIIAVLITVFALVALVDHALAALPTLGGETLSLRRMFGWIFAPLMWLLGVPWDQAPTAGALMGTKAILNEYVGYQQLAALEPGALDPRSTLITVYAMCGFANLASIGLGVSTIGTLCPARRAEATALGWKSWIAGNLATLMTGAIVGLLSW